MARHFMKLYTDILVLRGLTPATKLVYTVLVDAMRDKGVSWPGHRSVASATGLSKTTAAKAVDALTGLGLLVVERGTDGRPNRYMLPMCTAPDSGTGVPESGTASNSPSVPVLGGTVPVLKGDVPESGTQPHQKLVLNQTRQKKQKKKQTGTPGFSWSTDDTQADVAAAYARVVAYWNEHRGKPKVAQLTKARREKLKARFAEPTFAERWQEAIDRIAKAPADAFCNGGNDRGWRLDLDFFIKNDTNYVRVLEGRYTKAPGSGASADRQPTELEESDAARDLAKRKREGPIIFECREKWPEDVVANLDDYRAISRAVETSKLPFNIVTTPWARHITGQEFRDGCREKLAEDRRWKKAGAAARDAGGGV